MPTCGSTPALTEDPLLRFVLALFCVCLRVRREVPDAPPPPPLTDPPTPA